VWRCPASPSWQTYFAGARERVSRRSFRNTSRGTWRSALARLRFRKHELQPATLVLLASRWASEVHQNRSIGEAVADASKPETCLGGVEVSEFYNQPEHFIFPSERLKGSKPLDLASVLKKARSNVRSRGSASQAWAGTLVGTRLGPCWRRWANTRSQSATTCGTATFNVTNKHLQATSKTKRLAKDKLVDAILPRVFCRRRTYSNECCL
jgi:hypothetical protein